MNQVGVKRRIQPSRSTNTPAPQILRTCKKVSFFPPDLSPLNPVIRESGYRFIFTSSNTVGRNVVSKRGRDAASSHQPSGVYIIECKFPGCHQHYYGRSLQFSMRTTQHVNDYNARDPTKPLWKHCMEYPGHTFSPAEARILWYTRNLYMSKFIEAACINSFHSCNRLLLTR